MAIVILFCRRVKGILRKFPLLFLSVGLLVLLWEIYSRYNANKTGNDPVPLAVLGYEGYNKAVNRSAFVLEKYFGHRGSGRELTYEALIRDDEGFMISGLGDGGSPSYVPEEVHNYSDILMKKEAFNLLLSDMMPYNRKLDDSRNPKCKELKYDDDLPSATVVIIFTNEAWSTLIRTIHSVLNGSPDHLLKEIILVDDYSDREVLQGKLEYYLKTRLPAKVILHRLPVRSGLIRSRLEGAKKATGDVLIFLDAHCEVVKQWLEPLLQRIKEKRNTVVMPIIDVIDDKTLAYSYNKLEPETFQIGGFSWSGHFTWFAIPAKEMKRRITSVMPARSPTMAGGLLAVDRHYFWEVGAYDEKMDVWGGENLEMSFRVWQCGGSLEIVPCSRVGHIFRDFHPYTFPGGKDTHGINTARLAEVWMDDYKRFLYMNRPDLKKIGLGDMNQRMHLRKTLLCKSFKWYLDNVYPEKFILDENVQAYGRVRSKTSNLCLDNLQRENGMLVYTLGVYACHNVLLPTQYFSLSRKGELRREDVCAEVEVSAELPRKVLMYGCHGLRGNQEWSYTKNGELRNVLTGLCADALKPNSGSDLYVNTCSKVPSQKWTWDHLIT